MATAKHRAIDLVRRRSLLDRKYNDIGDDLLRLIFTSCHPVLSNEVQLALTLRLIGGLTTNESRARFSCPSRLSHTASSVPNGRSPTRTFLEGYSATAGDEWPSPRCAKTRCASAASSPSLRPGSRKLASSRWWKFRRRARALA